MCKSGGLVAFTAKELGLSDLATEIAGDRNGHNRMKPRKADQREEEDIITAEVASPETSSDDPAASQNIQRDYYGRPIRPQSTTAQQSASRPLSDAQGRTKQQG